MLIRCNMTHGTAKDALVDALHDFKVFHSQKGHQSAFPIVSTYIDRCDNCRQTSAYSVTSYSTRMFEYCKDCGYYWFNSNYYSKTTKTLQNSIIAAFPDLKLSLD